MSNQKQKCLVCNKEFTPKSNSDKLCGDCQSKQPKENLYEEAFFDINQYKTNQ